MATIEIEPILGVHQIFSVGSFFGYVANPTIQRAPASLSISITGATGNSYVAAEIDGTELARVQIGMDGTGQIVVPILGDDGTVGTHTVDLVQYLGTSASTASVEYEIVDPPALLPAPAAADAPAEEVPARGSKWVLQDAYPGGLGSYILPVGPSAMTSPHYEHSFNSRQTKYVNGQFHIFQASTAPKEWSFNGYADSEEMVETLNYFRNLNRRIYIIDHHGRAWKAAVTHFDAKPRLRHFYNGEPSDWGSDWEMTVTLLSQDPVTL